MVRDVPLEEDLAAIVDRRDYRVPVADVEELFRRYEFTSLVRRLKETVVAPSARDGGGAAAVSPGGAARPEPTGRQQRAVG